MAAGEHNVARVPQGRCEGARTYSMHTDKRSGEREATATCAEER